MKPLIFISSVSRELRSARQLVANTLIALGYEPVWQDIFETSSEDIRPMLRRQIDSCSAVLQIIGHAYGAEPPKPDETFGRCSYTQYEVLYAKLKKKPVYYLIAENELPRDAAAEAVDTPRDDTEAAREDAAQRQRLQAEYRQKVLTSEQIYYPVHNHPETELSVRRLRDDLAKLRRGFRTWMIAVSVALLLIAGGVGWNQWSQHQQKAELARQANLAAETKHLLELEAQKAKEKHEQTTAQIAAAAKKTDDDLAEIKATQAESRRITAASIRTQLIESSEAAQKQELELAEKEPAYDERERLRELAKSANAARLSRIDDLATSFAEIEQRSDTTDEFREMTRILSTEKENAVEKALAYAEKHRSDRFERVRARKLAEQQQSRADLQVDLKAASTAAVSGQPAVARKIFEQVLAPDVEPNWPEALQLYCWFLFDQSIQAELHGTLKAALVDAELCLELAERLVEIDSERAGSERVLASAYNQMGDVLIKRGQPGDAEQALAYFKQCHDLFERLLIKNPDSAQAARDVSVSLNQLGGFLVSRGQAGDAEQALAYFQRSVVIADGLLKQTPDSPQAMRDVSISLDKLSGLLASRGLPGDAEQALANFQRSVAVADKLLTQNPDSALASRDLSVSLNQLGDFLLSRGQPGDAEQALANFQRSLLVTDRLLTLNPNSAQAMRDVSVSLFKLGNFLSTRGQAGDAEQALAYFKRCNDLFEQLLKENPSSGRASRDVSVSLNQLGVFLTSRGQAGDADQALIYFMRSLEVRERLLMQNPDSAQAARDVSISLDRLGALLSSRGQPGDAELVLMYYERSLKVRERQLSQNPNSAQLGRDVMVSHYQSGEFSASREKFADAIAHYQHGIAVLDKLLEMNLTVEATKQDKAILEDRVQYCQRAIQATGDWDTLLSLDAEVLPSLLSLRVTLLAKRGMIADVAQAGGKLRELASVGLPTEKTKGMLYNAACAYSLCAGLVVKDKTTPSDAELGEQKRYIDLSFTCLREAIAAGYDRFEHIREDTDLTPLHGLPEFEELFPKNAETLPAPAP